MAWLSTWAKRVELTVPSTKVDSNLTHFPVPIFLGSSVGTNNKDVTPIFDEVGANSKKIAVTKSDGTTEIYVEIEKWDNGTETAVLWVSKSDLVLSSSGDTILYIYYDNAKADNTTYVAEVGSRTEVWDSENKGVWHLRESGDGTLGEFVDSTSNNNDGQGGAGAGANTPTQVDAKIGKGQSFDGNDWISNPDAAVWDLVSNNFTISLKAKFDSTGGSMCMLGRPTSGTSYFYLAKEGSNLRFRDYDSGNILNMENAWPGLAVDTWYDVEVTRDGSNIKYFVNGSQVGATDTSNPTFSSRSDPLQIGANTIISYYITGDMDEVRWSVGSDRGQAWRDVRIDGDNDDLISFGNEETYATEVIEDLDIDIRAKLEEFTDIDVDIRAKHTENIEDIDTDIRASILEFIDIDTDIRVTYTPHFSDIDSDIRAKKLDFADVDTDIRVASAILKNIDSDIRVRKAIIEDVDVDIRVGELLFSDVNTDIRVAHRVSENQIVVEELYFEEGEYLSSSSVTLRLKVHGALKMQFKNESGVWSTLETFSETKSWTLSAGNGDKQVFVRFTDIQHVLSDGNDVIETILNDTTPTAVTIEAYTDETATVAITDSTYQIDTTPFFRWAIPVFNIPYIGFSYALDAVPTDVADIDTPDIVRNGMLVSKKAPASNLIFEAVDGYYYFKADLKEFSLQEVTVSDGDATFDRIDIIYVSGTSESLNIAEGTPSASPQVPDTPEDSIELAQVYVPTGIIKSQDATLTDIRETYVELDRFLNEPLTEGQHTFKVKGICANGLISNIATFNIWVANDSLIMGEIKCYTDSGKTVELANGTYQTTDNTPYFEWTPVVAQPGPIRYYYTEDGTEPDSGDSFLTSANYTPGVYSSGITILKIKPYDVTTGYWGEVREFVFVYDTQTFTDDTAVISGSTTLKQSLKEVHVKEILWDFNSARTCRFFQPAAFDATLPFSYGDTVCVVYGSTNATVFRGRILEIARTIDIGQEGVIYSCSGPRQELSEEYAYIIDDDYGETAQITFDDVGVSTAINTIVGKFPDIVKNVDSYPTGANITDEYVGQVVSQVLDSIYSKTKYNWYIKPNGSLVSVDLTATNPGQAKFGIYGTTVNAISPQYNVMAADLKFDVTNRYNKCIIEGAKKLERVTLTGRCGIFPESGGDLVDAGERSDDARYKTYQLDTKWSVVKLIKTYISYARLKEFILIPIGGAVTGGIHTFLITFLKTEICRNNNITRPVRKPLYNTGPTEFGTKANGYPGLPTSGYGMPGPMTSKLVGFSDTQIETDTEIQGGLVGNNVIKFSRAMYNYWPNGVSYNSTQISVTPGITITDADWANRGYLNYYWRNPPNRICASLRADVLIETVPFRVEVTEPGTASSLSKTLRIVNTSFKYSEDPDNPIDDTAKMTQYAEDILQKYKDIKVNGTITLDTIDLSWDLTKTVNLINTAQAGWSSLNAKIIGITYDFDSNTTVLEITSEYLK